MTETNIKFSIGGIDFIIDPSVPEGMALIATEKEARTLECIMKASNSQYLAVTNTGGDKK